MDVREKLVEQLREVAGLTPPICEYQKPEETELFGKKVMVYCKPFEQFQELLREAADYIAHGVTVGEWIPVKDRLPKPFENVLVFRDGKISIDYHEENGWFAYDFKGKRVTHWMPLPQPPKGE